MQKFSKSEAIKFGWKTTKANLGILVVALLIVFLIPIAVSMLSNIVRESSLIGGIVFAVTSWVLNMILAIGLFKFILNLVSHNKAQLGDLFRSSHLFFKYLLVNILYSLIVSVGLLLLIVPGILLAIKLHFCYLFVVDKEVGPIEALKRSWNITKGVKWNLFLFWLMLIGINILGFLALVVGLLVTIPLTMTAMVWVYRKLESSQ